MADFTNSRHETQNPKRVAGGKAIAEKTRQAREAQKKALAEAQVIIANNQLKQAVPVPDAPSSEPPAVVGTPPAEPNKITTTQWLSVISIIVSLVGVYYKREEIKGVFTKKEMPRVQPPSPVLPRAPPPSPSTPKRGIRKMD